MKNFDRYPYGVYEGLARMMGETSAYIQFNLMIITNAVRRIRFGNASTPPTEHDIGAPQGNITGPELVNRDSNATGAVVRKGLQSPRAAKPGAAMPHRMRTPGYRRRRDTLRLATPRNRWTIWTPLAVMLECTPSD